MMVGPSTADLASFLTSLSQPAPTGDEASRLDRITVLEQIKAAAAAEQARLTVAFKQSRVEARRTAGVRVRDLTRGIGSEIALARQESPWWGSRFVGFSDALVHEMPHTLAALTGGVVSEYGATLMVAETGCLTREHRIEVDRQLGRRLVGMSTKQIKAEARRIAYRLDPAAFVARAAKAEADRRVTSTPAPETMMNIHGLLPVVEGAAVMAALTTAAATARAAGDPRSKSQVMADTLVERVTGQTTAGQTPVEIQLIITDQTLFGDDHTPAWTSTPGPDGAGRTIQITTPTGHTHQSRPPPLPGQHPPPPTDQPDRQPLHPPVTTIHWNDLAKRTA